MLKDFIIEVKNYAIYAGVIWIVIQGWALLKKNRIEKTLLTEEKKIIIELIIVMILVFIFSLFCIEFAEWKSGEDITDLKKDEMWYLIRYVLIFAVLYVPSLYFPTKAIIFGTPKIFYFINHAEYGKLYIIKTTGNNEILLSNQRIPVNEAIYIFQPREFLHDKQVHTEINRSKFVLQVRSWISKKKKAKIPTEV